MAAVNMLVHACSSLASFAHASHVPCPQLPCFGYGKPVEQLRARFKLELSDAQAAAYMQVDTAGGCMPPALCAVRVRRVQLLPGAHPLSFASGPPAPAHHAGPGAQRI